MAKRKTKKVIEEFDKYSQLKYILLWFGIPASSVALLNYFEVRDKIIGGFIIIIAVLLVDNYLKSKEIGHLKNGKKKKK